MSGFGARFFIKFCLLIAGFAAGSPARASSCRWILRPAEREPVATLSQTADFPRNGTIALELADDAEITASYRTATRADGSYLEFVQRGPPGRALGVDSAAVDPGAEIGARSRPVHDGTQWALPTVATINEWKRARDVPDWLIRAAGVTGAGLVDGALPEEIFWRHLANGEVPIDVDHIAAADVVNRAANAIELARRSPEVWTNLTNALRDAFVYLDARYPELAGHLAFPEAFDTAQLDATHDVGDARLRKLDALANALHDVGRNFDHLTRRRSVATDSTAVAGSPLAESVGLMQIRLADLKAYDRSRPWSSTGLFRSSN